MRELLLRFRTSVSLVWQRELYRRLAKLGGVIAIAFVLIAGVNLIFGSWQDAQATSRQSFKINGSQDESNMPFDFQFIGQGRITGGSDDRWMIGNIPIQVGGYTRLSNDLHPGDFVTLSGRILQNKVWLADRIELIQEGESFFTFNGPLEWVRGVTWRIGGFTLITNPQTRLGRDLTVNDLLLTTFTILNNGNWLALEIKAFDKFSPEPSPIPTETPIQTPTPTNAPIKTVVSTSEPTLDSKSSKAPRKKQDPHSKHKKDPDSPGKGKNNRKKK